MAQQTRWLEFGQPVEEDRVEVAIRTGYETGPSQPAREDDVERGTVDVRALALLGSDPEISEHEHSDGAILLSALSSDAEERLLETFERDWLSRLEELVRAGCSPAEALDYAMTEERGLSQTMWAERRGVSQQAVADAVAGARDALTE